MTVSAAKLIREMDAAEILAYLKENEVKDAEYVEAMRQYQQLTGERLPHHELRH